MQRCTSVARENAGALGYKNYKKNKKLSWYVKWCDILTSSMLHRCQKRAPWNSPGLVASSGLELGHSHMHFSDSKRVITI